MSERSIELGGQVLPLTPINPELAEIIVESEGEQHKAIEDNHRLSIEGGDFLTPVPGMEAIQEEISHRLKMKQEAPQAPHAWHWAEMKQPAALEVLHRLKDQVILDLGNGKTTDVFQQFLKTFDPRAYIGVDSRNLFGINRRTERIDEFGDVGYLSPDAGDVLPGMLVRSDMLRVASRLPDNSVSVAVNGIDNYVVKIDTPYHQRLMKEVVRILSPEGIIFGLQMQPGLLSELMKEDSIKGVHLPLEKIGIPDSGYYLMQKR